MARIIDMDSQIFMTANGMYGKPNLIKPYHCFNVLKVEGMLGLILAWWNFEIMTHATALLKKRDIIRQDMS